MCTVPSPTGVEPMSAPKVGVLTFHRCINYGSYWQARCLVDGIRGRGYDALLLDHESVGVARAERRCAFQPLLPQKASRSDRRLYGAKTRRFLKAFDQLPRSARFSLDDPAQMERFDLVVVGSDEVWNLSHPWYGGQPIFYGVGLNASRVVSYAASFGNQDASAGLDYPWRERLRSFASISVRDENSRRMIREGLGEEPELVLDPVLQFPPSRSIAATTSDPFSDQPYIAVYGHGFPSWFKEEVRRSASARRYRLISIGYRNDWADEQRITAGPEEFARLIAGSVAVATNFFHGCVFALLNSKPFVCASSPYRSNKVRDLTRAVSAEERLVDEDTKSALGGLLIAPLETAVGGRIDELRRRSTVYLNRVLG